jgi:hypothetical protein
LHARLIVIIVDEDEELDRRKREEKREGKKERAIRCRRIERVFNLARPACGCHRVGFVTVLGTLIRIASILRQTETET